VADQAACDFRYEQHGRAARGQAARPQARNGAACTFAPDGLGLFQFPPIAGAAVPVVALHILAAAREHHAAQCVRGGWVAADEAMRIAVDMQALVSAERCTFGIVDSRIEFERCCLAGFGDLDRPLRGEVPGMRQIQILSCARHESRIREPRGRVLCRESGDAASLCHRRPHRIQGEIRRTGRALALPEIDRNSHAAIALVLQGFHLAESNADGKSRILADSRLGLRGASAARFFQGAFDDRFKVYLGEANRIAGHGH
jgi:hypothetical protein